MNHLNSNILCAIDCETSGLKPGYHDLLQVAIIPLDYNLEPRQDIIPFNLKLRPMFPQNADPKAMQVNRLDINDLLINGTPLTTATDLFEAWYKQLQLRERKKIMPLAHNLPFDKMWFIEWLGEETYNHYFDYHGRDSMCAALFLNDRANFACEKPPFPKVNLQYLASQLAVVNEQKHDALHDALTCAKVYKKMLGRFIPAIGEPV